MGGNREDGRNLLQKYTGIEPSPEEAEELETRRSNPNQLRQTVSDIISSRAGVAWTTRGHTAVDVHLYAYGPGSNRFVGHHDNSYVGQSIASLLDIDLVELIRRLRAEEAGEPATASNAAAATP